MLEATEHIKQDVIGKKDNNSLSEIGFEVFKELVSKSRSIRFNHALAESLYFFDKHVNRGHKDFITSRNIYPINHK